MTALSIGTGQDPANLPQRANSIPPVPDGHLNGGLKLPA